MAATKYDAIIVCAVAFAFVGFTFCFFYLFPIATSEVQSDYEICINKCPSDSFRNGFSGLECPNMCKNILDNDINCTKDDEVKE